MRIIRKVFIIVTLFSLLSCESEETKLNKAKEVVKLFASSTTFQDDAKMHLYYPNIGKFEGRIFILEDFEITDASLNENIISVIGRSQEREISFDVEKENGKYIIIRSKGLSMFFNSNLYKYCRQIGCIKEGDYDVEISKICTENKYSFEELISKIKNDIEQNVRLENHTVSNSYGYFLSGDITYKNYSRFTIPSLTYNLYVEFLNSKGEILFKKKEILAFSSLTYQESNTIPVHQDVIQGANKIAISLEITNTNFIEKIIAEHAKGNNCIYSNNL